MNENNIDDCFFLGQENATPITYIHWRFNIPSGYQTCG